MSAHPVPREAEFYLQDSRSYVGNDVLFWAKDGKGYTTDLRMAHVYSQEAALAQHHSRPSDIPWPKAYIDAATRPAVDMQYIDSARALQGTGIVLSKAEKSQRQKLRCVGCGIFMSEVRFWGGPCRTCNTDNRP